jgi:hypothetical protein
MALAASTDLHTRAPAAHSVRAVWVNLAVPVRHWFPGKTVVRTHVELIAVRDQSGAEVLDAIL